MLTFRPLSVPRKRAGQTSDQYSAELAEHVEREMRRIQLAANTGDDFQPLRYLNVAPERPQDGIYLADGTNWNPGSGRGAYRYDTDSATYTFLG